MQTASKPYPSSSAAWFLVIMLTIAYVFSYIDRAILGLLIEPIKRDLGLSDEQIGWVIGPAFAIFYATMGLPLGWAVDRTRRTWLVGVGIAVWSLATAVSGLAKNFWHLFLTRMTVGVGEATLSPSAMSLIADSFPPERRGKAISVYVSALTLGGSIAYFIGSKVIVWSKSADTIAIPILGQLAPWQLTFIAVGLPGLLVSLVFFFIREPERRPIETSELDVEGNGVKDAVKYISNNLAVYVGFISLACVMAIIAYSHGFLPSTFQRTWGWLPEQFALYNATALLVLGPLSAFMSGYLSDKWTREGKSDAALRILVIGALIMVPSGALPYFMPTPALAFAFICINTIGIAMVSTMAVTAVLAITPGQIRGQIVALYYMAISLTGLFLGPTSVGMLSTRFFGEENIRYAMATLPIVYGIIPLLFIPLTMRLYRAQLARIEASQNAT